MANQMCAVTVVGFQRGSSGIQQLNAAGFAIGLGTSLIESIEPYVVPSSGQPIPGVTIATVIKMFRQANTTQTKMWLSTVATATVVTAAT